MLSAALPKLNANQLRSFDKVLEDFAYVYWAGYAGSAIDARVNQALQRAWGHTSASLVAGVGGNQPGYVQAYWDEPGNTRITIAIAGLTVLNQLATYLQTPGSIAATPLPGHVFNAFLTQANVIKAQLLADTSFTNRMAAGGTQLTITGFSLGAAIAEILASQFQALYPTKPVRCKGFAAPRVGTAAWANGTGVVRNRSANYVESDPIHLFPYITPPTISVLPVGGSPVFSCYAPTINQLVHSIQGEEGRGELPDNVRAYSLATSLLLAPLVGTNPWIWHDIRWYRLAYCNLVSERGDQSMFRFRYLEYNNENTWGINCRQGTSSFAGLEVLNGTQPPPIDVDIPRPQMQVLQAPVVPGPRPQNPMPGIPRQTTLPAIVAPTWTPRRVRDY